MSRSSRRRRSQLHRTLSRLESVAPIARGTGSQPGTEAERPSAQLIQGVLVLGFMLATRFFFRSFRSAAPVARPTAELQCIPDEGLLAGQLQKSASAKPPGILREFLQAALLTLLVFFLIRLVAGNFRVSGDSMEPTLLEGQILGVNRLAYAHLDGTLGEGRVPNTRQGSVEYIFGGPQRGDIVVFRKRIGRNLALVKRVIGLPGDRILIGDGRVFVNGQPVDEPYVRFPQTDKTYPEDGEPVEVPDGSYFVLGDNRPESSDSREDWFVPVENLVGRVWLSYWPPATWGTVR